MDIFEKQQTIEAIKTVIKARWFYVSAIAIQGVIIKLFSLSVAVPNSRIIFLITVSVFLINFTFWLYLRRPQEKISQPILKIIKFSQIPLEQLGLAAIFYFSGTANKMLFMMYIIPIMVGSALYKRKGIILATFSTLVIYNVLVVLEYLGLMPALPSALKGSQLLNTPIRGNLNLMKMQIIFFDLYIVGAAFYAGYLSDLFKRREKQLIFQKNELGQKTEQLTLQTQELTHAKDQIQGALVISDVARRAATQSRDEAEKANTELQKKIDELEKFYKITVGREVRMVELKEKIKELEKKMKEKEEN